MPYKNREHQRAASARHYRINSDRIKARARRFNVAQEATNKAFVADYLKSHPCVDCGEADPIVLEFDHVRGKKRGHVSVIVGSLSLSAVKAEIAKCEVRCANCHRRITYKRRIESQKKAGNVSDKLLFS